MTHARTEIEELRAGVSCATVLENASPAWRLDRAESSRHCLKYRRGAGEIVIVNHNGAGWWDPMSDAKGDVFNLVQHLEPRLNFGGVRKALRPLAGIPPAFTQDVRTSGRCAAPLPVAERWARRRRLRRHSHAWLYLSSRGLPEALLLAAAGCDVIRDGPYGSAWFAHRTAGVVTHVDVRGPTYKGSLTGGAKSLFWFPSDTARSRRAALAFGSRKLTRGGRSTSDCAASDPNTLEPCQYEERPRAWAKAESGGKRELSEGPVPAVDRSMLNRNYAKSAEIRRRQTLRGQTFYNARAHCRNSAYGAGNAQGWSLDIDLRLDPGLRAWYRV